MAMPRERAYCVAMFTASCGDSILGGGGRGYSSTMQADVRISRAAKSCFMGFPTFLGPVGYGGAADLAPAGRGNSVAVKWEHPDLSASPSQMTGVLGR